MENMGSRSRSRSRSRNSKDPYYQYNQKPIMTASSLSIKTVFLEHWWLVKSEHQGIAVAGFALSEIGERFLVSGAICKRIHATAIQTRDGITVTISGIINRSQTLQNGFPLKVCNRFLVGFPFDWEECVSRFYDEESGKSDSTTRKDSTRESANYSLPPLDKLPATRIHELVLLAEDSDSLLRKLLCHSNLEKEGPKVTKTSEVDQIPIERKKAKTDQEGKDKNDGFLNEKHVEPELTQSRGVVTRSRHRSKEQENITLESSVQCRNFTSKHEKNLSSNFSLGNETTAQLSTPPANKKMSKRPLTNSETRSGTIRRSARLARKTGGVYTGMG